MNTKRKILIADDEPVGRQLLEAILFSDEYDLHFAEDGKTAYETAVEVKPELILLDVMMPEMDGYEVCKKLRKSESIKNVPIILITALDDRDSRIRGLDAGANDYISKPFDRAEVLAKVKNIMYLGISKQSSNNNISEFQENKEETDLKIHYTSLIQRNLLPSNEHFQQLLSNGFCIIQPLETLSSNMFWLGEIDKKIIIVSLERKNKEIIDVLQNILIITLLNKLLFKAKRLNSGEILDELNNLEDLKDSHTFKNTSIVLIIIDNISKEIQISGTNFTPILIKNTKLKKLPLPSASDFFSNTLISLGQGDKFYIISPVLYGELEKNKLPGEISFSEYLEKNQNLEIEEEKKILQQDIAALMSNKIKVSDFILFSIKF